MSNDENSSNTFEINLRQNGGAQAITYEQAQRYIYGPNEDVPNVGRYVTLCDPHDWPPEQRAALARARRSGRVHEMFQLYNANYKPKDGIPQLMPEQVVYQCCQQCGYTVEETQAFLTAFMLGNRIASDNQRYEMQRRNARSALFDMIEKNPPQFIAEPALSLFMAVVQTHEQMEIGFRNGTLSMQTDEGRRIAANYQGQRKSIIEGFDRGLFDANIIHPDAQAAVRDVQTLEAYIQQRKDEEFKKQCYGTHRAQMAQRALLKRQGASEEEIEKNRDAAKWSGRDDAVGYGLVAARSEIDPAYELARERITQDHKRRVIDATEDAVRLGRAIGTDPDVVEGDL